MSERHPDTIATIDMNGTVYEIDWPRRFDDVNCGGCQAGRFSTALRRALEGGEAS